jgi:hypothetical protein
MNSLFATLRTINYRYRGLVPPLPRRIHVYTVGMGKTGTNSLHGLFSGHYRSAHEVEHTELIGALVDRDMRDISMAQMIDFLRQRDRRLRLEMDASMLNGVAISDLMAAFPRAKFILTIRDCYTWLDSHTNHHIAYGLDEDWERLKSLSSSIKAGAHPPEEQELKSIGVAPIERSLRAWTDHNSRVLNAVPTEQLLVLRTHEISTSIERIADFTGIRPRSLLSSRAHSFKRQISAGLLDKLSPGYLESKVEKYCGRLMNEYFPSFDSLNTARSITSSQ